LAVGAGVFETWTPREKLFLLQQIVAAVLQRLMAVLAQSMTE
jgi:hypothetical protein